MSFIDRLAGKMLTQQMQLNADAAATFDVLARKARGEGDHASANQLERRAMEARAMNQIYTQQEAKDGDRVRDTNYDAE